MRKVTLPGTGLNVSVLCLGTGNLGREPDPAMGFALLDTYVEQGGNFIDTALIYSDWMPGERSISEKTIGKWLRERKNRNGLVIATKGCHPDLAAMNVPRLSRKDIISDIHSSLGHMGIDTIDLYWLHRDDTGRPAGEIIESLEEQVKAGIIRCYGCSNWTAPRIEKALEAARSLGIAGFVANQACWSLAPVNPGAMFDSSMLCMDEAMKQLHFKTKLTAIPYSSQANGWFQRMASGPVTGTLAKMYDSPGNQARFDRVRVLSQQSGFSITQVILGYLMAQPVVVVPILGSRTVEQLRDSMSAGDVRLNAEQVRFLETGE